MDDSELMQVRTTMASAHDSLREIVKTLEAIADELFGQPVANQVSQAIDSIKVICTGLRIAGPELVTPLDKSIEQDRVERALSEVNSGEYDVQG